jgi:hypothetical protein
MLFEFSLLDYLGRLFNCYFINVGDLILNNIKYVGFYVLFLFYLFDYFMGLFRGIAFELGLYNCRYVWTKELFLFFLLKYLLDGFKWDTINLVID